MKHLKATILTLALVAPAFAQAGEPFVREGRAQCTGDCAISYAEAESAAELAAEGACAPARALRVSEWNTRIYGFGRVIARAEFTCAE